MRYLASPYSHPNPAVMEARVVAVCKAAAGLMAQGVNVFSPIVHSHALAVIGGLDKGWEFWREIDFAWIRACGAVWVLTLDGWRESVGVQAEIAYARQMQMAVSIVDPATLAVREFDAKA